MHEYMLGILKQIAKVEKSFELDCKDLQVNLIPIEPSNNHDVRCLRACGAGCAPPPLS